MKSSHPACRHELAVRQMDRLPASSTVCDTCLCVLFPHLRCAAHRRGAGDLEPDQCRAAGLREHPHRPTGLQGRRAGDPRCTETAPSSCSRERGENHTCTEVDMHRHAHRHTDTHMYTHVPMHRGRLAETHTHTQIPQPQGPALSTLLERVVPGWLPRSRARCPYVHFAVESALL